MGIKQFNCEYLPKEDRLVFRLNTDEGSDFLFLFTRRIALFILSATHQLMQQQRETQHIAPVAKAIGEFEAEAAREQVQFHSQYDVGSHFPLGSTPLLVQDLSCKVLEQNGQTVISMDLILENNKTINLQLWGNVLQNMRLLLERMLHQAAWTSNPALPPQKQGDDLSSANQLRLH